MARPQALTAKKRRRLVLTRSMAKNPASHRQLSSCISRMESQQRPVTKVGHLW